MNCPKCGKTDISTQFPQYQYPEIMGDEIRVKVFCRHCSYPWDEPFIRKENVKKVFEWLDAFNRNYPLNTKNYEKKKESLLSAGKVTKNG